MKQHEIARYKVVMFGWCVYSSVRRVFVAQLPHTDTVQGMTSHTLGAGAGKGGEAVKLLLSLSLLLTLFLAGTATPADAQSTTTTEPVTTTATDTPSPSTTTTVTPPPDTTTTAAVTTGAAGSTTSPSTGTTVSSNTATPASSSSPTTSAAATAGSTTTTTTAAPSTTGGGSSGSPTATATGAPTTLAPAATPSTESDQSIQWYHVTVGVLGLFVIVGGACYVTLMWQQNAIRNYKNTFEEMVKKIGLKRNNLAEALRRERDNDDADAAVRRPDMALEDVRAVTAVGDDAASPVAGPGAAGSGVGASAGGGAGGLGEHGSAGGALLSAPTLGVGKLHTYQARTARMAKEEEARAARALEVQLLRQHREEELGRRRAAAGSDLLSQAVFEAVGVDRSIELVERRAQWRSLRSLDLGE